MSHDIWEESDNYLNDSDTSSEEKKEITIDQTSLKNLIGSTCKEVMVYGLKSCLYYEVMDALIKLDIEVDCWSSTTFPIIQFDEVAFNPDNMKEDWPKAMQNNGREFKSIITSLVIENCKRETEGKPLIPLLFCIGLEKGDKIVQLDYKKLAGSHSAKDVDQMNDPLLSSITEKELRRCYKIYAEGTPKIKSLIEKTFKFLELKQDTNNENMYSLQQLPPMWENPVFQMNWKQRKQQSSLAIKFPKRFDWRSILNTMISSNYYNPQQNFFRPLESLNQTNDIINRSTIDIKNTDTFANDQAELIKKTYAH